MEAFRYKGKDMYCENVNLSKMTKEIGDSFYVYSYATMIENFDRIKKAFSELPNTLISFSVKSNSNIALLRSLIKKGAGCDIVSEGELLRALKAGVNPDKIIFAGVGKVRESVELALNKKIHAFNVESIPELYYLNHKAGMMNLKAPVCLRVNPDVDAHTHEYITTGKKENKFGVNLSQAKPILKEMASLKNLNLLGIHAHIGSQILEPAGYVNALYKLETLINDLRAEGVKITTLNLGGGFGISYENADKPLDVDFLSSTIVPRIKKMNVRLILEPGRYIVGPAGAILTWVIYLKKGETKNFLIVNCGMNDLIRPSLYGAYHRIEPVRMPETDEKIRTDVVGPICESGDFLGKDRMLPPLNSHEWIIVREAGAYGMTMASNYNSRPRLPEYLVKGKEYFLIRERETFEDLVRHEKIPEFLK